MWKTFTKLSASLGPGFITAALVLGPGSVTVASKAGATFGYRLIWVTIVAAVLMASYTAMSARIGAATPSSLLTSVKHLYGRWLAILMGVCSFLVCCSFQAGDNLGVSISIHAILEGAMPGVDRVRAIRFFSAGFTAVSMGIVLTAPSLYKIIERLMTALVAVMIVSFFANLFPARPSLAGIASGLLPRLSVEQIDLVTPMVATTFSVIAAVYQCYIVQNKGWTLADYRRSVVDSMVGIAVLALLSVAIVITAAAVLEPRHIAIRSAGEMAVQLEPLLGRAAKYCFAIGLWGASFSSLVANAMVGGGLLADSLGLGSRFDNRSVKILTAAVMLAGALSTHIWAEKSIRLIVLAQALTIPLVPVCALVLLLLANNRKAMGDHTNGAFLNGLGILGLLAVGGLAVHQAIQLLRPWLSTGA